MKNFLLLLTFLASSVSLFAQENSVTLSGGYAFAKIEDTDIKVSGWRINGMYEFNPMGGMFSHGVAFGYIGTSADEDFVGTTVTYKLNSMPIYYAPKVMFGNDKLKGFVKGALGMQFAKLKVEGGLVDRSDNDFGFYGGGGAGFMVNINESIFINAEYEIAWLSNSWYKDGWMNSVMGGIGMRF